MTAINTTTYYFTTLYVLFEINLKFIGENEIRVLNWTNITSNIFHRNFQSQCLLYFNDKNGHWSLFINKINIC